MIYPLTLTLAQATEWAGRPWGHGPFFFFGPLMGLLWLALIASVIYVASRRFRPHERTGVERARDILAERFARGEISPEEYRERVSQLG